MDGNAYDLDAAQVGAAQAQGINELNEKGRRGRETVVRAGQRQPSKSAPGEIDPFSPRYEGYRVPRIIADPRLRSQSSL